MAIVQFHIRKIALGIKILMCLIFYETPYCRDMLRKMSQTKLLSTLLITILINLVSAATLQQSVVL